MLNFLLAKFQNTFLKRVLFILTTFCMLYDSGINGMRCIDALDSPKPNIVNCDFLC